MSAETETHVEVTEEAVEMVMRLRLSRSPEDLPVAEIEKLWRQDIRDDLQAAAPIIHRQAIKEVRERLQILDFEIVRCQELGDIWAEEGIDAEFPASPEDRARFFHEQRDKLKELRAVLSAAFPETETTEEDQ